MPGCLGTIDGDPRLFHTIGSLRAQSMLTVVLTLRVESLEADRARNLMACLASLQRQTLPRQARRLVLIEQGATRVIDRCQQRQVDEYRFVYNPNSFNRSWLLNIVGLRLLEGVMCTFDVDMVVPRTFLQRLLLAWRCGVRAIKPFDSVLYMSRASTALVHQRIAAGQSINCDDRDYTGDLHPWSRGGCTAIDVELYRRMGGHDERFEGWGVEDNEFYERLERQTKIATLRGRLLHMYHERSHEKRPEVRESAVLYRALQEGLLPPQRGPLGDPEKYRHRLAASAARDTDTPVASSSPMAGEGGPRPRHRSSAGHDAVLIEAWRACRVGRLSSDDQRRAARLNLRGNLASHRGYVDAALACLRAASRGTSDVSSLLDLGQTLVRGKQFRQAIVVGLQALRLVPHASLPYRIVGHALREEGFTTAAVTFFQEALLLDLSNATIVCELGDALSANGQNKEALTAYEMASRLAPQDPVPHHRLGNCHLRNGAAAAALDAFEIAQRLSAAVTGRHTPTAFDLSESATPTQPRSLVDGATPEECEWRSALHQAMGRALFQLGRMDEAVNALSAAATYAPTSVSACHMFALALDAMQEGHDAVGPRCAQARALATHGRELEAADAFERALDQKADCLKALLGLGDLHLSAGRWSEAISHFERALVVAPEHSHARIAIGRAAHAIGAIDRGWDAFGAFDDLDAREARRLGPPCWDGSPLAEQTILVQTSEALGDAIQELRYLPILRAAGARIVLQCPLRLVPLARRLPGVELVVAERAPLPAFNVHVPLFQVPVIQKGCRWPVPPSPREFRADARLVERWARRLEKSRQHSPDVLTVGLSWTGHPDGINARVRFTQLEALAPLAEVDGVRFVSVQMGQQVVELHAPPTGLSIAHLQDDTCSLDDTAALMACLDVIVTVDTGVAHLAAALGRPAWMALPHVADFRWMDETERTPLYPSMRIFRQTSTGDWKGVFERVRNALIEEVDRRRSADGVLVAHETTSNRSNG